VLLYARDRARGALLVERCVPGTELWNSGTDETDVVSVLLPRLQIPVTTAHPFTLLATEADRWAEEVPRRSTAAGNPFERALLEAALDVYRTVDRTASYLVNQDLHGGNVLSASREPWLVIDPKPLVGEREFGIAPIVRSRELGHSKRDVLGRFDRLVSELELDRERARGWTIAQTIAWGFDGEHRETHVETARWLLEAR